MASASCSGVSGAGKDPIDEEDDWPDAPSHVPQEDDSVECGCCYEACAFDSMVQCEDGHLFCTACVRRHVETSIFGCTSGQGRPLCLATTGCSCPYPLSQMKKCFSDDDWLKYEQRQAENDVAKAKLSGLVYCFHCKHPWEVDPGTKIFKCLNHSCLKGTCLKCNGSDHTPESCKTPDKKTEDHIRLEVEESMTKAVIRVCSSCSAELVKTEGCNRITCRCGQQMCYLCRMNIEGYDHFCPHVRSPQTIPCDQCSLCVLFGKEDECRVIRAAKLAALEKLAEDYPDILKRKIGPSEEPVKKHHKRNNR